MDEALILLTLGTLVAKLVDFFKYLTNKQWNGAVTQLVVWASGVIVMVLAAASDAFSALVVPGFVEPLGALDGASLVILGMSATSFISKAVDFQKAFDQTDSAAMPPLTTKEDTAP